MTGNVSIIVLLLLYISNGTDLGENPYVYKVPTGRPSLNNTIYC